MLGFLLPLGIVVTCAWLTARVCGRKNQRAPGHRREAQGAEDGAQLRYGVPGVFRALSHHFPFRLLGQVKLRR